MTKKYQTSKLMTSAELRHAVPERVSAAMREIAQDVREGLLALAVGTGLQLMHALMEEDVTALCGPRGKRDPARTAVRQGDRAWLGHPGRASGAGISAADTRRG